MKYLGICFCFVLRERERERKSQWTKKGAFASTIGHWNRKRESKIETAWGQRERERERKSRDGHGLRSTAHEWINGTSRFFFQITRVIVIAFICICMLIDTRAAQEKRERKRKRERERGCKGLGYSSRSNWQFAVCRVWCVWRCNLWIVNVVNC